MASFVKFECFTCDLANKIHNLGADALKIMLTNTGPTAATDRKRCDITEVSPGGGYTAGGCAVTVTASTQSGGVYKLVGNDVTWLASGGQATGPFRYVVLYNSTPTNPNGALIGYWDYGSSISINVGETFTVDLDQTNGILTIT